MARLFFPRWAEILLILSQLEAKDRYYQRLLRHTKAAGSYVREVLHTLETEGFVEVKKSGRIHRLVLTAKGNQLAFHLLECARVLGQKPEIRSLWR